MPQLTYAKTGGPPDNWKNLQVIDASGNALPNIVEVNIAEALVRLEAAILAICHRNLSPDAAFRDSFDTFFQTEIDVNPVN